MTPSFKIIVSIASLLALSACSTLSVKEKTAPSQSRTLTIPTSSSDPLNIRIEADYNYILAALYSHAGQSNLSIEHFKNVLTMNETSAEVHMNLSAEYLKIGQTDKAISHVEQTLAKDPQNFEAHLVLGSLYAQEKEYDKALRQYYQVLKLQPTHTEVPIYIASIYAEKKDYKKAEESFKSLLNNPAYKDPHMVYYYLGLLYMEQETKKNQTAAESAFITSLKLKPDYEEALISLTNLYLLSKKSQKALALCLEFQKQNSFRPKIADLIVQIYIEQGELGKAYKHLELIASHQKNTLDVEMKMALLLIEQKQMPLAAAKLQELVTKYPTLDSARYYLAAVFEEIGSTDNAVIEYMQVPPSSPHFSEAVVHAAHILKSLGKLNQALDVTEKGLKSNTQMPQMYTMYASLLDAKSDYLGALRILEKGLSKFAQNAGLLFQYAVTLDRLGKKEGMIAQLQKVLELDPAHVDSMSYLAFSFAELNEHLNEAETLARRAFALQPTNGYVADTLGWVLFKQQKFSESIKVLEKAYGYQSSAGIIAEHLADAYAMNSMYKNAQNMYQKAISLSADPAKIEQIRSKMRKLIVLN